MTYPDSNRFPVNRELLTRFFSKVKISTEHFYEGEPCWEWFGSKDKLGYGRFYYSGKSTGAYNLSYQLFVEILPPKYVADHLCRNPSCVNPVHLDGITQSENMLRAPSIKARMEQTHCKYGHPFDEQNTLFLKNGNRQCRECSRQRSATTYAYIRQLPHDHPKYIKWLDTSHKAKKKHRHKKRLEKEKEVDGN